MFEDSTDEVATGSETPSAEEAEARLLGWKPEEEFDGPPERWRSAAEFLEKGKQINGFLRRDFEKIKLELAKRDQQIKEIQAGIAEFAQFHQETEKRVYERARADLLAERKAALRDNDGERVVHIEERIEELNEAARTRQTPQLRQPAPPHEGNQPSPEFLGWVDQNPWYKTNRAARALANDYSSEVAAGNPGLKGIPFLEEVKRLVTENHPEIFENPARRRATSVSNSGESRGNGGGRGKDFSDLPPDAQAACDKFIKQGHIKDRATYVKSYFEDK